MKKNRQWKWGKITGGSGVERKIDRDKGGSREVKARKEGTNFTRNLGLRLDSSLVKLGSM